MDTQALPGRQQLLSHLVGDMAHALCQRRDEPQARQVTRAQAAAESILAFMPGDAVEAMIAGHCVMLHELIVDTVQTALSGEPDASHRATRNSILAMDKAFGANLARLERYRARHRETSGDAASTEAFAETEIAGRVRRHQAGSASGAACHASPEAPSPTPPPHMREASPATVTQMPRLNRQARRAIGRLSRKRIDPATSPIANAAIRVAAE
jgi:hypothetical protein